MNSAHANRQEPMHRGHVARRPDCGVMRCLFRAGQRGTRHAARGTRQSKKEFLRRCKRMHANHADGPEPGMVVHGSDRSTTPWRAAPVWQPLSHLRVLRTSACICVKPLLASTRAARCCDGPRTLRASQNPMHQFPRLPPPRRPSGPEADIIDALPEPHAPIRPPAAAAPSERAGGRRHRRAARTPCTNSGRLFGKARRPGAGRTPYTRSSCPTGAAHRLARSAMRRW